MQNKFKLNREHYSNNDIQIYYAKTHYEGEVLEHL